MFLCSLFEELCTKDKNDKTGCNFNFGHECIIIYSFIYVRFCVVQVPIDRLVEAENGTFCHKNYIVIKLHKRLNKNIDWS